PLRRARGTGAGRLTSSPRRQGPMAAALSRYAPTVFMGARLRGHDSAELLPPATLLAEAHLLGKLRAGGRIIGRHHGIIRRKTPFVAVLLGRHVVLRAQVPLQRLELLSVL